MSHKVSIIIPIYNKELYIEKCIISILKQSYKNIEVIIINDGSTDCSDDIIRKLLGKDHRLIYYSFPNSGVSVARNTGISKATGEYIMFIDSDDYIEKDFIKKYIETAILTESDIVIGGITKVFKDGRKKVLLPQIKGKLTRKEFLNVFVEEQYNTQEGLYGFVPNKLIKRSVIESNKIYFNTTMKKWEDYDFFLSCYNVCNHISCIQYSGYYYECNTMNSSSTLINQLDFQALINVHTKCLYTLMKNDITNNKAIEILRQSISNTYIAAFLEMKPISLRKIRLYLSSNIVAEKILKKVPHKFSFLRKSILSHKALNIYSYLIVWNFYLYIKRIKL